MTTKRSRRGPTPRSAWAAFLIATAVAGCGGGEPAGAGVAVSGKVSFDGRPVEEGTVTLVPLGGDGSPVTAPIKEGVFRTTRADGLSPGKHRVEIQAFASLSDAASAKSKARAQAAVNTVMFGKSPAEFGAPPESAAPRVNVAPERYNARSELIAEIPNAATHELEYALAK